MSNQFIQHTPLSDALGDGVRDLGAAGLPPDAMLKADLGVNSVSFDAGLTSAPQAPSAPKPQEFLADFKAPTPGGLG